MNINTVLIVALIIILIIMLFKPHVTVVETNPVQPVKPIVIHPSYVKPVGGCAGTQYGCCPNGVTARMNPAGTNC